MEINQHQKQEQRLAMTPQMLTSIAILQLSGTDLMDFLTEEAQSNPALDSDEVLVQTDRMSAAMELVRLTPYIDQNQDTLPASSDGFVGDLPIEATKTFADHLITQINLIKLPKGTRDAAVLISQSLDEWGYLRPEDEDSLEGLPDFQAGLTVVQSLEPSGVGARGLPECLIIQLRHQNIHNSTLEKIIQFDLELLAAEQFDLINERYDITNAQTFLTLIKKLNPKPAAAFQTDSPIFYVIPDLTFEIKADQITVILNEALIPKISVSSRFLAMLQAMEPDQKPLYKQYIRRLLGIIEAVEKRNNTLLRIGERIAFYQTNFILGKTTYQTPLSMSTVAKEIGLNVSTVSRAVREKYVSVNGKVVRLKNYLEPGYYKDDQAYSTAEIKDRIRNLIQTELPEHPLSDQRLTNLLTTAGIAIKRRTVAKYREAQNIPVSYKRHKK